MASTEHLDRGPIGSELIDLALPLLAGNILQQLYNMVDAVIVGRVLGDSAFAAIGVAGSVMNLFLFLISGGCAGVGILLSQLYGAGDGPCFRRDFWLATVFGGLLSLALSTLGLLLLRPLLSALRTPAAVLPHAERYLKIIFLGFPLAFAYHLGSAVLRSVGNTLAALGFLLLSMLVNLGLDLAFVAGLHSGTEGAAWATALSQALAALLCLLYLRRRFPQLLFKREDRVFDASLLRRTAWFAAVSALHNANLYIGKLLVQRTVNGLGQAAISAYTGATRLEGFANSFGDSGASAMSVFIGQNTGARQQERVRQGFHTGQRLLLGLSLVMTLVMILGARPGLALVLPVDGGLSMGPALSYLRTVACFYLFNFLGSGLVGYFNGRGKLSLPVVGATGHITFRVVASALLAGRMGLAAVALASGLGWMGAVAFWYIVKHRKKL